MRLALGLALALTACFRGGPTTLAPDPAGRGSSSSTSTTTTTAPTSYPPADFTPPKAGLAVGIAEHVVIDDVGSRLFVRKDKGIDILAIDTGTKTGHIDIGWEGDVWPAGARVLAMRTAPPSSIDIALVDPASAKVIATCSASPKVPPNSAILRVDEFTTHAGTTYLKWETAPPPGGNRGGAAMSNEQIEEMNREFQAAYACGLYAIHVTGSRCTLDVASYKDAGLESCETRSMPWNRYLPTPIGNLALSVERSSTVRTGLYVDTETLIVKGAGGGERWRLPIETRATPPPPP